MRKNVIVILILSGLMGCTHSEKQVSGKPYDVLKSTIYNELQEVYSSIGDFELGTAIICKGERYGLINNRGKEVLPCLYDTIFPLCNDRRYIAMNNLWGMADVAGNLCTPCVYEDKTTGCPNHFPFKKNGKWGFLTKKGEIAVQFKFDDVYRFTDSIFVAKINGKCGLFTYSDRCILEPNYDRIDYKVLNRSEDPSYVFLNGKLAVLNSRNEFVTDFEYTGEMPFYGLPQEGKYVEVARVAPSRHSYNKHRYGLLNYENGKLVIPCEYESLGDISEGVLYAKKNDKYGYIDLNNQIVIPFKYEDAENFSEGLARVAVHKGYYNSIWGGKLPYSLYGFIDKTGKFIIPPSFPDPSFNAYGADGFYEGLAAMGERPENNIYADSFGYINIEGEYVIPPIYEKAHRFMHGVALVCKDKKYGCIDRSGNIVVDLIYDDYEYRSVKDSVVTFEKDKKKYSFRFDGTPVL